MSKRPNKIKLPWKPVRSGERFCSPACGAGCTYAQYKSAIAAATACIKRMNQPKQWAIHVHENMGWFWNLKHKSGHLTVSGGQIPYGDNPTSGFHAMLSSTKNGGCDAMWYDSKRFSNPNRAVDHRIKMAKDYQQGINNLIKAILP